MDQPSGDMRGTKRKAEDEGEHEEAKRQDGMVQSCLRVKRCKERHP